MSTLRLAARVPSARPLATARLVEHRLAFHKRSVDGSGKCDAEFAEGRSDSVFGVVFDLDADEKRSLDRIEGLGHGYAEKGVTVVAGDGAMFRAFTYYATRIDPALRPYHWYKQHVLWGAREHTLPSSYIDRIAAVESVADPDASRHRNELAIYVGRRCALP